MSKVIVKLNFKHPNRTRTPANNMFHLNYIATRPGTDMTLTESDLGKELSRDTDLSEDDIYMRYMHHRPGSHGLFGPHGHENLTEAMTEIRAHNSFVWRAIVSLKEEDAVALGYTDKSMWQDMLRAKMPDVTDALGLKNSNVRWVAAVHMEKGHPHAHLMMWEIEKTRTQGIFKEKQIQGVRKIFTDEIFSGERENLLAVKNAERDLMRTMAVELTGSVANELRSDPEIQDINPALKKSLPPRLHAETRDQLYEELKSLSKSMPGEGRVALKFMPEDVKAQVREIADKILERPEFGAPLAQNLNAIEELTRMYTSKEEDVAAARERGFIDVRDRIAQVLLKAAAEAQKESFRFLPDPNRANAFARAFSKFAGTIDRSRQYTEMMSHMTVALRMAGLSEQNIGQSIEQVRVRFGMESGESTESVLRGASESDVMSRVPLEKRVDFYLASLKTAGMSEEEAFKVIGQIIDREVKTFEQKIETLSGIFTKGAASQLTAKGYSEFLPYKNFDGAQKRILKVIEGSETGIAWEDLYNFPDIRGALKDKDPDPFKVSFFDQSIAELFKGGSLTPDGIKDGVRLRIDTAMPGSEERFEKELAIVNGRIDKLMLNGYIGFDKTSKTYTVTEELKSAIKSLKPERKMTKWDVGIFVEKIESAGTIDKEMLFEQLRAEIGSPEAEEIFERCQVLMNHEDLRELLSDTSAVQYLAIFANDKDSDGENPIFKVLASKGILIEEDNGRYVLNPEYEGLSDLCALIIEHPELKELSALKDHLKQVVPNLSAEAKLKGYEKRIKMLTSIGHIKEVDGKLRMTENGIVAAKELLEPERGFLRKELDYLVKLGILSEGPGGFKTTRIYESLGVRRDGAIRPSVFDDPIFKIADRRYGVFDGQKLRAEMVRSAMGKYKSGFYDEIKMESRDIAKLLGVRNDEKKVVETLVKALCVSGASPAEVKQRLGEWNERTNSLPKELLEKMTDSVLQAVNEKTAFGHTEFISKKDWENAFQCLGVVPPPDWIFKQNHGAPGKNLISSVWNSVWKDIERQKNADHAAAAYALKRMKSSNLSKEAMKEMMRRRQAQTVTMLEQE